MIMARLEMIECCNEGENGLPRRTEALMELLKHEISAPRCMVGAFGRRRHCNSVSEKVTWGRG